MTLSLCGKNRRRGRRRRRLRVPPRFFRLNPRRRFFTTEASEPMKNHIDCIAMKRRGSLEIHRRLKGLNLKEQLQYWTGRNAVFHQEQEMLRAGKQTGGAPTKRVRC